MQVEKHVLCEERTRRVPEQFSWVDHRLVRWDFIRRCDSRGWALYLLLVTVGDAEGLSYYSDRSISAMLRFMDAPVLDRARRELLAAQLIAYERPLYQVLDLDEAMFTPRQAASQPPASLGELLQKTGLL